jgi:hypothetical protein
MLALQVACTCAEYTIDLRVFDDTDSGPSAEGGTDDDDDLLDEEEQDIPLQPQMLEILKHLRRRRAIMAARGKDYSGPTWEDANRMFPQLPEKEKSSLYFAAKALDRCPWSGGKESPSPLALHLLVASVPSLVALGVSDFSEVELLCRFLSALSSASRPGRRQRYDLRLPTVLARTPDMTLACTQNPLDTKMPMCALTIKACRRSRRLHVTAAFHASSRSANILSDVEISVGGAPCTDSAWRDVCRVEGRG